MPFCKGRASSLQTRLDKLGKANTNLFELSCQWRPRKFYMIDHRRLQWPRARSTIPSTRPWTTVSKTLRHSRMKSKGCKVRHFWPINLRYILTYNCDIDFFIFRPSLKFPNFEPVWTKPKFGRTTLKLSNAKAKVNKLQKNWMKSKV